MVIFLIRHGMTAGNALKRYIGRTDEPLSQEGSTLARERGCFPAVRRVWVSPLLRTRQTAAILFPNAEQRVVPGLREMDFGDFENRSADEMEDDSAYRTWVKGNCVGPCPNGEQISEFSARACAAFIESVRTVQNEKEAVFVVHGGTIMAILSRFSAIQRSYYDWFCDNCGGWRAELSWNKDIPVLNNCTFLKELKF